MGKCCAVEDVTLQIFSSRDMRKLLPQSGTTFILSGKLVLWTGKLCKFPLLPLINKICRSVKGVKNIVQLQIADSLTKLKFFLPFKKKSAMSRNMDDCCNTPMKSLNRGKLLCQIEKSRQFELLTLKGFFRKESYITFLFFSDIYSI
jgi:hypothetical protein